MSWSATKPQGIAGVGSRPCASTMRARKAQWTPTTTHHQAAAFAAFAAATKPAAGGAAVYGTGVSMNRVERPEGPRGRAG